MHKTITPIYLLISGIILSFLPHFLTGYIIVDAIGLLGNILLLIGIITGLVKLAKRKNDKVVG